MYRFALRPKWIMSHLLVAALVLAMLWAGFWQLGRLSERQEQNRQIAARADLAEVPIEAVVRPESGDDVGAGLEYLRVSATGTFDRTAEVLVRNRPLDGSPGRWVLTPLVLDDGRAVIVNRGWIPNAYSPEEPRTEVDPPTTRVTVSGFVRPTETASGLQIEDPDTGTLASVARPNLARLDQQTTYSLLPVFIQMEQMSAPVGPLPIAVALPPLDGGPHFGYAMQWFIFSSIAILGYPMILRRVAHGKATSATHDADEDRPRAERGARPGLLSSSHGAGGSGSV